MPLALPPLYQSVAYGAAALIGCFAAWYLGKKLVKWLQAYRNRQLSSDLEDARKQAQEDNRKANSESDTLKQIDGR